MRTDSQIQTNLIIMFVSMYNFCVKVPDKHIIWEALPINFTTSIKIDFGKRLWQLIERTKIRKICCFCHSYICSTSVIKKQFGLLMTHGGRIISMLHPS